MRLRSQHLFYTLQRRIEHSFASHVSTWLYRLSLYLLMLVWSVLEGGKQLCGFGWCLYGKVAGERIRDFQNREFWEKYWELQTSEDLCFLCFYALRTYRCKETVVYPIIAFLWLKLSLSTLAIWFPLKISMDVLQHEWTDQINLSILIGAFGAHSGYLILRVRVNSPKVLEGQQIFANGEHKLERENSFSLESSPSLALYEVSGLSHRRQSLGRLE